MPYALEGSKNGQFHECMVMQSGDEVGITAASALTII